MSDTERQFPMPEVLPKQVAEAPGPGKYPSRSASPYVPRPPADIFSSPEVALNTSPLNKIGEIKTLVRTLLHREMRDLVKEIFEAHGKIPKSETASRNVAISVVELADTLDKFAFGD